MHGFSNTENNCKKRPNEQTIQLSDLTTTPKYCSVLRKLPEFPVVKLSRLKQQRNL